MTFKQRRTLVNVPKVELAGSLRTTRRRGNTIWGDIKDGFIPTLQQRPAAFLANCIEQSYPIAMFPMHPFMWPAFTHGVPFGFANLASVQPKEEPFQPAPTEANAQKSLKRMFHFQVDSQTIGQ